MPLLKNYTYNTFIADFETVVEETEYFKKHNRTRVLYGVIKKLDDTYKQSFIDVDEMFACLIQNFNYSSYTIYFHNLSFDGVFILDFLGKQGFKVVDIINQDFDMQVFRTTGSKIYNIKVKYNNREFQFKCSKLLLSASVKALGKCVNIDKYASENQETEEFYIVEPEKTVEEFEAKNKDYCLYCERDVEIVRQSLIDFYNSIFTFLKNFNAPEPIYKQVMFASTISQVSLILQKLCATNAGMNEEDLYITLAEERDIMDKFTNGGLTVCNEKYRGVELEDVNGHVIDLKSAYPAIMSDLLPYGPALSKPPLTGPYCTFQEVYYDEIEPKNHQIPLLKNWGKKDFDSPNYFLKASKYTTYLLKEERELLEQLFNFNFKMIIKEYHYPLKPYLKEFVDYGFKMKEQMKKEGKMASSHTYKILLNSAYGIHAKRMDFKLVKPYMGETYETSGKKYTITDINLNETDRHSWIPYNNLHAYNFLEWVDFSKFKVAHKGIANYITAKTRCKLLKGIIDFKPDNFLYCDTDSLFIMNIPKEELSKHCGPNLGDWELENKEFESAIVMRAKTYQLYDKDKLVKQGLAGVNKEDINLREARKQEFLKIVNATKIACRVDGGLVLRGLDKILQFAVQRSLEYNG